LRIFYLIFKDLLKWKGFSHNENTWVKNFFFVKIFFLLKVFLFQEPAENLECPGLIAAFMAEQKEKQQATTSSSSKSSETSNGKRSHSTNSRTNEDNNNSSQTKRSRIELEQTGYGRDLVPETLMGATDIYDGELMFL
jgi:hypothetical protein